MSQGIILKKERLLKFINYLKTQGAPVSVLRKLTAYYKSLKPGEKSLNLSEPWSVDSFKNKSVLDHYNEWSKKNPPKDSGDEKKKDPGQGNKDDEIEVLGGGQYVGEIDLEKQREAEKAYKKAFQKVIREQEAALRKISQVLKGGDPGSPGTILTKITCEEPAISSTAGAISGFVPRYLYHISPASIDGRLKSRLKTAGLKATPRKAEISALMKAFKRYGKAIGVANLLAIGAITIAIKPELLDFAGDTVSKPASEAKKLSELLGDFRNWAQGIENIFDDATYVLDQCFLASFVVGFAGIDLLRVVRGTSLKALETQRFLKEFDQRTFGDIDEYVKHISRQPGGMEYYNKILAAQNELKMAYIEIAKKLDAAGLQAEEKYIADIVAKGLEFRSPINPVGRARPKNYPSVDIEKAENVLKLIGPELETIIRLYDEQGKAFETFLRGMQNTVLDSLAANTQFFRVFDAVPGAKITAKQVGYLNRITKEAGEDFLKSFKALDSARENFIKSLDDLSGNAVSNRNMFISIEKKIDQVASIRDPDFAKAIKNANLTRSERNFLANLPENVKNSMNDLYRRKADALNQIDRYEANVAIFKGHAGDQVSDLERLSWGDTNDLITKSLNRSNLKNLAIGARIQRVTAGELIGELSAGIVPVVSLALYKRAVGDVEAQLSPENIKQIHNFLKAPDETKAKQLEKAIASIYIQLANRAENDENVTYGELLEVNLESAIEDGANINVTEFKGTDKAIAIVLAFEYLKNPATLDLLSKVKRTDIADPRQLRLQAYNFNQDKLVMTEDEYSKLFISSYARVKEVLQRYARKENINLEESPEDKLTDLTTAGLSPNDLIIIGDSNATLLARLHFGRMGNKIVSNQDKNAPKFTFFKSGRRIVAPVVGAADPVYILRETKKFFKQEEDRLGTYQPKAAIIHMGYNQSANMIKAFKDTIKFLQTKNVTDIRVIDIKVDEPKFNMNKPSHRRYIEKFREMREAIRNTPGISIIQNNGSFSDKFHFGGSYAKILNDAKVGNTIEQSISPAEGMFVESPVPKGFNLFNAKNWLEYRKVLNSIESGSAGYAARSDENKGMWGMYQMSGWARNTVAKELGIKSPSWEEFKNDPDLQERMYSKFTELLLAKDFKINLPWYKDVSTKEKMKLLSVMHHVGAPRGKPFFRDYRRGLLNPNPKDGKNYRAINFYYKTGNKMFGENNRLVPSGTRVLPRVPGGHFATKREYKINDLKNLVSEVMNEKSQLTETYQINYDTTELKSNRRITEMKRSDLLEIISEVLKENSGQGYGKYPYDHMASENEPAEDYIEEWKALSLNLVRDESRNTAIKIAKLLVKDLELFEDVLDLAGQNQSVGVEILRKLKESEEKT